MDGQIHYSRKISSKEADNDFIFILKNKRPFFPELGEEFELKNYNSSQIVKVESYPCTCRGPDKPHEHYFIRWKGLKSGERIDIIKRSENESKYSLRKHLDNNDTS
jgi:hypothetical protein